jgi:opacity protein-like surface antigen
MKKYLSYLLMGVSFVAFVLPAQGADLIEAPVMDAPEPVEVVSSAGGWYIRGDVGYANMDSKGVHYHGGSGLFDTADAGSLYSLGGGVGYQITDMFRVDVTGDYEFNGKFRGTTSTETVSCDGVTIGTCNSVDEAEYTVFELMANAYADFGTFSGFTPYVGAGLGLAQINWDDLKGTNVDQDGVEIESGPYDGRSSTRFAWALMAGTSYDLSSNMKLDLGYRYKRIEGGEMFGEKGESLAVGYDKGFNLHQVKLGLRYQFGANGMNGIFK